MQKTNIFIRTAYSNSIFFFKFENVHHNKEEIPYEVPYKIQQSDQSHHSLHRVDRVLSFFYSRPNWGSTTPHIQASVYLPPPLGSRGDGHTRLRERGWGSPNSGGTHSPVCEGLGSPNSDEGTNIVVMYFVTSSDSILYRTWRRVS
jgi:hypothetical protein